MNRALIDKDLAEIADRMEQAPTLPDGMTETEATRPDRSTAARNGSAKPANVERALPADIEAEEGVIGSIAILPSVMADVSLIVDADDFFADSNRVIFQTMVAITNSGKPIDVTLVVERLRAGSDLDRVGGSAHIARLFNAVPNAAHAKYYAGIVREKSRLRKIIIGCTQAVSDAYDQLPPEDVLGNLEQSLSAEQRSVKDAEPISRVWDRVIESNRQLAKRGESPALLSGLPSADRIGFVFVPGELSVLAARPTVGKTSLATQIAMHHAGKGRPVLYASLEMDEEALGSRVLLAAAGLNHQSIRTRGALPEDIDSLVAARDEYGELPLYVWAPPRVKVGAIRAMAAAVKSRHGLKLLIVDYTAWIIADDPRIQRRDQIGEIVKALRDIGKRLSIPVLLLHQLNREGANEKPQLTHLRESGCVEEDADIVAFIHPVDAQPPQAMLIVAKSRQGAKGECPLWWHPAATRFSEMDDGPVEDRGNFEPSFGQFNQREFSE